MKRVFLAIVGVGLLLFLAVPILHFWFRWTAGPLDTGMKQQVVDNLMWGQIKSTGRTVALSRNDQTLNFFDIGDLALSSQPLVQNVLNKLSHASSVTIERGPDKRWSIGIFHDTKVFTRLKSDKQAFRAVGLPDHIIDFLVQKATSDARCVTMTRTDDEMNIVLTVVLSSQQTDFDGCLVGGLLNSFGIKSAQTANASDLMSACVLYAVRRLGVRDRQQLSEQASTLRDACQKKTENSRQ